MWKQALIITALFWLLSAQHYSYHLLFSPLYCAVIAAFLFSLKPLLLSKSWNQLSSFSQSSNTHYSLLLCCFLQSTTYIFLFSALVAFAEAEGEGVLHSTKLSLLAALVCHLFETILTTEKSYTSHFALSSSALSNLLMTWTIACQGGMCYTLYISTFTSVLGAFGVTVIDMVDILRPLQFILLIVFLVSLYKASKTCCYGPLYLGILGTSIIVGSLYIQDFLRLSKEMKDSSLLKAIDGYGVLLGNVVVVGSSLWNLRKQGVMQI